MFHFHCSIVVYCMITCAQLRLTICDPMDCSPPGSPVLEIFLAISLPFPTPGDRPDSGFKPVSLAPPALVGVHAKSLQSCPAFCDHQAALSMRILQARILEWVAIPSSRRSSQPRD